MEKEISFIYSLSQELCDRLRVNAIKEKGKIINFIVQAHKALDICHASPFLHGCWG